MGGYVDIDSAPEVGTPASLLVPRASGGSAQLETAPAPRQAEPQGPLPAEKLTILYCEDENHLLVTNAWFLSSRGFEVLIARSGARALELAGARDQPISLLITDVSMPEMTGTELMEQMRDGPGARFEIRFPRDPPTRGFIPV